MVYKIYENDLPEGKEASIGSGPDEQVGGRTTENAGPEIWPICIGLYPVTDTREGEIFFILNPNGPA